MTDAAPSSPRIRLTPEEAWDFVEGAHTGILGTLRSDGMPIMLPIWFVVIERRIYVRTSADSKKAKRARRDARASFLVERGERWAESKRSTWSERSPRLTWSPLAEPKQKRSSRRSTLRSERTMHR